MSIGARFSIRRRVALNGSIRQVEAVLVQAFGRERLRGQLGPCRP